VALATKPRLLVLDEPMAGLGVTESVMVKLLSELRREATIVLVEHDMEGCLRSPTACRSWSMGVIRRNEEVKRAYLGDQHVVTPACRS
jgi:branched-chain amino acid transport system ATP-binding protein